MKEYSRMKLWGVSFWKPLFKEELKKIVEGSEQKELLEVLIYCYEKYSDMHPEILSEVFSRYQKQLGHPISLDN